MAQLFLVSSCKEKRWRALCRSKAGQFIGAGFTRQRRSVVIGIIVRVVNGQINRIGKVVFGIGNERLLLFFLVISLERSFALASTVADGDGLENIAVIIHLQGERMLDTGIRGVTFIVVVENFTWVREEYRVAIVCLWLQAADGEVLFDNGIGVTIGILGGARPFQGIDFLPQHGTPSVPGRLPAPPQASDGRQYRILEQQLFGFRVFQAGLAIILPLISGVEQPGKEI